MRCLLPGAALLLAVCTTAGARADRDKPKPDKPSTPAEEIKVLQQEYSKAQEELYKPLEGVKSPEEAQKIIEQTKLNEKTGKLSADFAKRAWALAEKHAADREAAVDVLVWVVGTFEGTPEAGKAADLIVKDHITDKKVDALLGQYYSPSAIADKLLPAAAEKITDPERRAAARFHLARYLKYKADSIGLLATMDEKTKARVESGLGKEYLAKLMALDPAKLSGEAEALFEVLMKDSPDAKLRGRSIKEQIEGELFELKNLAIGKVAPEIEGDDMDGKKLRLSEYRGKVVVLDFWGNW
jgi:hypothetical protein